MVMVDACIFFKGVQRDVGILPRSLEVIFNSIRDSQWDGCMLKPHMFCEVVRLPSGQEDEEKKMKNALLKQAELEVCLFGQR